MLHGSSYVNEDLIQKKAEDVEILTFNIFLFPLYVVWNESFAGPSWLDVTFSFPITAREHAAMMQASLVEPRYFQMFCWSLNQLV
jgi:hypothetical protein